MRYARPLSPSSSSSSSPPTSPQKRFYNLTAIDKTSFNVNGYFKTTLDLEPAYIEHLVAFCARQRFDNIFLRIGGEKDANRGQSFIKRCAATEELFAAMAIKLNTICEQWEIKETVVLKSVAGGKVQDIHRDMSLEHIRKAEAATQCLPVGIVLGLMQGTRLRVFKTCFGDNDVVDQSNKVDVSIGVGECLVFRGDLAHCGLSYKQDNYRIHFAVGINDSGWLANETHPVIIKTYDCVCGKSYDTKIALKKHHRRCAVFTSPEEAKAFRANEAAAKKRLNERKLIASTEATSAEQQLEATQEQQRNDGKRKKRRKDHRHDDESKCKKRRKDRNP